MVEKALEKNPAERYQSMREIVVDLKRAQRPGSAVHAISAHRGHAPVTQDRSSSWRDPPTLACVGRRGGVSRGLRSAIPDSFPREAIGVRAGSISDLSLRKHAPGRTRLRYRLTAAISCSPRPVLMA